MKSGGYVYILANNKMGTLYIGSTSDLVGRIIQHKAKEIPGFTAKYNVNKLVYYEWHDSLDKMVIRERQMKEWKRNWKIRLIVQRNPTWQDLPMKFWHQLVIRCFNVCDALVPGLRRDDGSEK